MRQAPVLVLGLVAAVAVGAATLDLESPYVIGNAGFGYTFAVEDGEGNFIVATNPVGNNSAVIIKTTIGSSGEPWGDGSGQVAVPKAKGHVTSGCISNVGGQKYLFAGLSVPGFIARVDLSFPTTNALTFIDATDELLWNNGPPQSAVSAVCQGQYVYFGTKSPATSSTVLRLDTQDTNAASHLKAAGTVSQGDLVFGGQWGNSGVIFVAEPDGDVPLSFYIISSTSGAPEVQLDTPASPELTGFESLSGLLVDKANNRVFVANANGTPKIAELDLSQPAQASTTQMLTLSDVGIAPITTFKGDIAAGMAYVSVGACDTQTNLALVAIRLGPTLTKHKTTVTNQAAFDCTQKGVPVTSVLQTGDDRKLFVFTAIDAESAAPQKDGYVMPYSVLPATACADNCNGPDHGSCAGGVCYCYPAYSGASCGTAEPCAGTNCNGHGTCDSDGVTCNCEVGWGGTYCSNNVTCPLSCSNHGACHDGACTCNQGYTGAGCEHQTVGCDALGNCNGHGSCVEGYPAGSCTCDPGYTGNDCATVDTSCANNCSGNGLCNEGTCVCDDGWKSSDCSELVANCPNNCSAHGTCNEGVCACYTGFIGNDCSQVDRTVCPSGCSGHGSCINGSCVCADGWKGFNCSARSADLRVAAERILVAGENKATSSFVVSVVSNEIVFCTASTPGKCVAFRLDTMERTRDATFQDTQPTAMLLEDAEGRGDAPIAHPRAPTALVPDLTVVSSVSLMQLGASFGEAPISVAVSEDTPTGFAILGTKAESGTMHGQLLKVSLVNFQRMAELEFDDDNGAGVTAGIAAGDGTYFFASGSAPATLYRVNSDLEIVAKSVVAEDQQGEVTTLLFDGKTLLAASGSTLFFFDTTANSIDAAAPTKTITLPDGFGSVTAGFIDILESTANSYVMTSGTPGGVVKVSMNPPTVSKTMRLKSGENAITTVTRRGDIAYLGLASSNGGCQVVKLSISTMSETDSEVLPDCKSDLLTSSISPDGAKAYFGNGASPAHVYSLRLLARNSCPSNCNGNGVCVDGTCSCNDGFTGDSCADAVSPCPNSCSHSGTCVDGVCQCNEGHFKEDCSVVDICVEKCQHGSCTGSNNSYPCTCESNAWGGFFCDEPQVYCPNECSGHGACESGTCVCHQGYSGEDCSTEQFPPVVGRGCQTDTDCGTHGVCNRQNGAGTCVCAEGWSGIDCDVDEQFRESIETTKISPILIALVVAGCLLLGMIGGVSIWKSWANRNASADPIIAQPSRVGTGNYARLPRRLVK